jgi:hypothetical protein
MRYKRGTYTVLMKKPEGTRPLERPRRRWEVNIRINFQKVGRGMDWKVVVRDRKRWPTVVQAVMYRRVPGKAGSFATG